MNLTRKLTILSLLTATVGLSAVAQVYEDTHTFTYSTSMTIVFSQDDVDVMPSFPGGECAKINFINSERQYPADEYRNRVQGRVVCSFVVNPDGSISDATVIRGINPALNQEALRIINAMPRWVAGQIDGMNVPVYQLMSITFRL